MGGRLRPSIWTATIFKNFLIVRFIATFLKFSFYRRKTVLTYCPGPQINLIPYAGFYAFPVCPYTTFVVSGRPTWDYNFLRGVPPWRNTAHNSYEARAFYIKVGRDLHTCKEKTMSVFCLYLHHLYILIYIRYGVAFTLLNHKLIFFLSLCLGFVKKHATLPIAESKKGIYH
jgi:hypothetical protein